MAAWTGGILPLNWCRFCSWPWRGGIWRSLCPSVHLCPGSRKGKKRQCCTGQGVPSAILTPFLITETNPAWHKCHPRLWSWLSFPLPRAYSNWAPTLWQGPWPLSFPTQKAISEYSGTLSSYFNMPCHQTPPFQTGCHRVVTTHSHSLEDRHLCVICPRRLRRSNIPSP